MVFDTCLASRGTSDVLEAAGRALIALLMTRQVHVRAWKAEGARSFTEACLISAHFTTLADVVGTFVCGNVI